MDSIVDQRRQLRLFGILLAAFYVVQVSVPLLPVPIPMIPVASMFVSVFIISLPIFAIFAASALRWTWGRALGVVATGAFLQYALAVVSLGVKDNILKVLLFSGSQLGLIAWCLGIGAFLASILKDKNLLLPISIFLALFDIWLVFVPDLVRVSAVARGHQEELAKIALQVPKVASLPTTGHAQPFAFVGPADLLFLGMFFVALFRFRMRAKETLRAMVIVLACYLLFVLLAGNLSLGGYRLGALPALVPIGLVILIVNRKEFRLTQEEKTTTLALISFGLGALAWRFYAHRNDSLSPEIAPQKPPVQAPLQPPTAPKPGPELHPIDV